MWLSAGSPSSARQNTPIGIRKLAFSIDGEKTKLFTATGNFDSGTAGEEASSVVFFTLDEDKTQEFKFYDDPLRIQYYCFVTLNHN